MLATVSPIPLMLSPPITSTLPSESWAWPEQKRGTVLGFGLKEDAAGFQRVAWDFPNASTRPVGNMIMWTATLGHEMTPLHCPVAASAAVLVAGMGAVGSEESRQA